MIKHNSSSYSVRKCSKSAQDLAFVGQAIIEAERGNTGIGIWDIFAGDEHKSSMAEVIANTLLVAETSLYYYDRFYLAYHISSPDTPVACACGYCYPECSLGPTMEAFSNEIIKLEKRDDTMPSRSTWDAAAAAARLDFLESAFPGDITYEGAWMIEAVYTHPAHRGRGLAGLVIHAAIDDGKQRRGQGGGGQTECLINCTVGNNTPRHVYEKLGFQLIGQGYSEEFFDRIGSAGLYVLRLSSNVSIDQIDSKKTNTCSDDNTIDIYVGGDGGSWDCSPAVLYQLPTELFDYNMLLGRLDTAEDLEAVMQLAQEQKKQNHLIGNDRVEEQTDIWVSRGGSWSGLPSVRFAVPVDVFAYLQQSEALARRGSEALGQLSSARDLEILVEQTRKAMLEESLGRQETCLHCSRDGLGNRICSFCSRSICPLHMCPAQVGGEMCCQHCAFVSCSNCHVTLVRTKEKHACNDFGCAHVFCMNCSIHCLPHIKHVLSSTRILPSNTEVKQCGHLCTASSVKDGCCPCLDKRPVIEEGSYPMYVDGEGWRNTAMRRDGYCPFCKY